MPHELPGPTARYLLGSHGADRAMNKGRADQSCNGWNYHVFPLASDRCSCCGWNRYATRPVAPLPAAGPEETTDG